MKKIKISISVNSIYFSYTNKINDANINQTSYIETGNLLFEYDYLAKNNKLISSFIKDITKQTQINTIKIKNLELVPIILKIVKDNDYIKKIYILDNKTIDTNAFLTIVDNKNIDYLNCYNIPSVMFNYLNSRRDILIEIRDNIDFQSDFMNYNKLNKYSTIFYKKSITINSELNDLDLRDLEAFLLINQNLQNINIKIYSLNNINQIYNLLIKFKKTNIKINIYQNKENLKIIFRDIDHLKNLKNKNIKINIHYEKDYILKNIFKQINISILRLSLLILLLILLYLIFNRY